MAACGPLAQLGRAVRVPDFEREPELMTRHRTTARGVFLLLFLPVLGLAAGAVAAPPKKEVAVPPIVFPVVGAARYTDDFGDARGGGRHQGIDILAARQAIAVAAEGGKVTFWTTSAAAGCMLYLHGDSGTTYLYIHLNNDVGPGNDNRGKCVAGTAYAPGLKDGARVRAGQQVGFVGDSGDADGVSPHLHFELHPGDGAAADPYRTLQSASHLLFSAPPGTPVTLSLSGSVVGATDGRLELKVSLLRVLPAGLAVTKLERTLTVTVPATALVQSSSTGGRPVPAALASARRGQAVVVRTEPAPVTLKAQRGDDGALAAALVRLTVDG